MVIGIVQTDQDFGEYFKSLFVLNFKMFPNFQSWLLLISEYLLMVFNNSTTVVMVVCGFCYVQAILFHSCNYRNEEDIEYKVDKLRNLLFPFGDCHQTVDVTT